MTESRRALVLVDIQNEYFTGPLEIQYPPRDASLARILRVVDVAGEAGIPVAVVQHELPDGAPVFAGGSAGWELHPELEAALPADPARFSKNYASIFDGTGMADWLRENSIDTVTLVGFMTNNCIIGSAVGAEPLGFAVEVLSDATGAIHISNEAGSVSAEQVHTTLMAVLNSNLAAVATTDAWAEAAATGTALQGSDLGSSAMQGRSEH
ncbi:cysteine hydrolase family protein [Dietzia cercidiphylli]|uniref:cysteine hydrolase family protein n=1 Tax=Dietzia cercidiphylli TaxID=498199 RepID=UPI0015CDFBE3